MVWSPSGPDRRLVLAGLAAATLPAAWGNTTYDAVVAVRSARDTPKGKRYASVGAALADAPANGPWRIWVDSGTWTEKLVVRTPNVSITGRGPGRTRIRFDAAAGLKDTAGKPWGTFGSATLTVTAPGFRAADLTIENGFDPVAEAKRSGLALGDWPGGQQAVALALAAGSDGAWLASVEILGRQDTLLVEARARIERSLISGTVDFIFGGGRALIRESEIRSRLRPASQPAGGVIAAPSTRADREAGLIIHHCRLTAEPGLPSACVFLGRAWRPTRSFPDGRYGDPQALGMAAFIDCMMGLHIAPAGWTEMSFNGVDGKRTALQPETARFYESGNRGPGAKGVRRSRPLDAALRTRLLADWIV